MRRAAIFLTWAAVLWGLGFIATVWALQSFPATWVVTLRFFIAWVLSLAFTIPRFGWRPGRELWEGIIPGCLVSATMILQTIGLASTTATKSAFVLGLYIFLVPLWERLVLKKQIPLQHWLWVTVALGGSRLILGDPFAGGFTRGDLLTVIATIFASLQIFWISYRLQILRKRQRSLPAEVYNGGQMLWSWLPILPLCILQGPPVLETWTWTGIAGMALLAIGSTWIAFHLQVVSQAHLSSSTASLICLLESPFAAIFSFIFLQETLELSQFIGCVLVMLAAFASLRLTPSHSTQHGPAAQTGL